MRVSRLEIEGVLLLEGRVFRDERGTFRETWRESLREELGIPAKFVQDNVSTSRRGVLRGLHMQQPRAQAKLVSALYGEIFDVCVDLRPGSPTFQRWVGVRLDGANQLFIPRGCAHGFLVTSEIAVVAYKCDEYYDPASELTILWNDPALGIAWPIRDPILSDRDRSGRPINQVVIG